MKIKIEGKHTYPISENDVYDTSSSYSSTTLHIPRGGMTIFDTPIELRHAVAPCPWCRSRAAADAAVCGRCGGPLGDAKCMTDNIDKTLQEIWDSTKDVPDWVRLPDGTYLRNTALQLWKDWFEYSGNSQVIDRGRFDSYCFFCSETDSNHAPDCVFVRAQNLLTNLKG